MSLYNEAFQAGVYEATGEVTIGGQKIPYRTVSQDNLIYDEKGNAIGSMFTYSYFRSDIENVKDRPVMFFFNGGPGAGSLWLHVGLFGPIRMYFENPEAVNTPAVPPYYYGNNDMCLLDICDLVFVDPVGTGYGRLLDPEAANRFYGMDEDAESCKVLIHNWLNKYNRWESPKYILGESYGTVRAGLLSDKLSGDGKNLSSVGINGIILLGNAMGMDNAILNFNTEESLLALPTMAAANWYHNDIPGTVKEFVNECYDFCDHDYVLALFQGDAIDTEERNRIAEKVAYFSGLKKEEILKQNLRPNMALSWQQVLEDRGMEIGRLDGRFTMPFGTRSGKGEAVALYQYTPAFMTIMCGPVKTALNITHNREYYAIAGLENWKEVSDKPAYECLACAMRRNRDMRLMFATGYYDMACTIGAARYLARHGGYPQERVEIREYDSGHMVYLGEDPAREFATDVRAFVENR